MKNYSFACAFLIAFWGCGHNHVHESGQEEPEKIQYTVYTPEWELFAETDPFVVGKPTQILAHFTRLADFKPLKPVPVSVTLNCGEREYTRNAESPVREGIYTFEINPEAAGVGRLLFHFLTEEGESIIEVDHVHVFSSEEEVHPCAHLEHEDITNCTVFTKEQAWKSNFSTGLPEWGDFGSIIRSIARVEPVPGEEMVISAKTNGMVLMSGNQVIPGTAVAGGQFLLTISGEGLADENIALKAVEAHNNFQRAEADFERKTLLSKEKLIPEKELLEAKSLYLNSKAVYENYRDNFRKSGQAVVSPMTGFIRQVLVQNGQYVEAGQSLLRVSQDRNLVLTADVLQKYLPELSAIRSVTLKPVPGERIFSLEELGGRILSVGKSINQDNGMVPVTLQISNSGDFIPGGVAEIIIRCKSVPTVLTVAADALMEEQGLYFLFVQRTPELFEKREVIPGASDGLRVVILSGLSGEERVVTKGAVRVKLAQGSGALDPHAGHVH